MQLAVGEPTAQSAADNPVQVAPQQASIGPNAYAEAARDWFAKLVELDPQRFNDINLATLQQLLEAEIRNLAEQSAGQPEPDSVAGLLVELANALGDDALAAALEGLVEEVLEYDGETGEDLPDSDSNGGRTGPVLSTGTSSYSEPSVESLGSNSSDTLSGLGTGSGDNTAQDEFAGISYRVSYDSLPAHPDVNDPPVAAADTGVTDEDTILNVGAPGVLANDSDPEGNFLTVTAFDAVSAKGAAVTVNANGSYTYDPTGPGIFLALAVGENATDTFTYTVSDSNNSSNTATVTITVTGVTDAPVAAADTGGTDEDTILNAGAPGVLANDTDPDTSDVLTVTAFDSVSTKGAAVTVNADGSYSYDSTGSVTLGALAAGENTTDTFTYTVSDGNGASDTATVTITVSGINDAPSAVADTVSTALNNAVIKDVLANDSDPDTTDTLSVSAVTQGTSGAVVNNGDGTVTYTPDTGFIGLDSFTYDISDGNGGSDTATVSATVGNVVVGTGGADTLNGTAGADAIYGYGGDDNLTGADGADFFYFSLASNEGSDSVLDFSTAEGDILSFTGVTDLEPDGDVDIDDVVISFFDGGGVGFDDTVWLKSGATILITDVDGTLTSLADLDTNSLINGV